MARKMTFTIPDELAKKFIHRIPARDRSRYLAEALAEKLEDRERQLMRACDIANQDPDVGEIEAEFDALSDQISEPWSDASAR